MKANLGDKALLDNKVPDVPRTIRAPAIADEGIAGDRVDQAVSHHGDSEYAGK